MTSDPRGLLRLGAAILIAVGVSVVQGGAAPTDGPADWREFQDWAAAELLKPQPAKPAPASPTLPAPRSPVIHLSDLVSEGSSGADAESDERGVVLTIGPFRSDQPNRRVFAKRIENRAWPALAMSISGFELQRDEVGAIVIELRQPFGDAFILQWSLAGQVRVPLPHNDRFVRVRIDTEGLPDWSGPLGKLLLSAQGAGEGEVEIRSIRFLRRTAAFPDKSGVRRVAVGRELRPAVYARCPGVVTLDPVRAPRHGRLAVGLAAVGDRPAQALVELRIEAKGRKDTVVSRTVATGDGWLDLSADLDAWAGRDVRPSLACHTAAAGVVALWGDPVIYEPVKNPPLVILDVIDAVGARRVGLYGAPRDTTPRLAQLAARGAWFDPAFANAPRTVESVPSLLYSLSALRHGVLQPSMRAPDELVALPEILRAAGFATGFYCTNPNAGVQQGMDLGFDSFLERYSYFHRGDTGGTVAPEEVTSWLDRRGDRPVFLYIHTVEPHSPYTPPEGFAGRFDADYDGSFDGGFDKERGFEKAREPRDVAHVAALHDEEIAYADARLGKLIDALARSGALPRAHIFVTADHGEEFFEHGFWEHGMSVYDPALRIPLVAVGPAVAARGRVEHVAQLIDVTPTILDLLGLPAPYPLDGSSLAPVLAKKGKPGGAASARLIFVTNHQFREGGGFEQAVIEGGRFKLALRHLDRDALAGERRFQLFDLREDPGETKNLIDEQQERARRLILQLVEHHRRQAPVARTSPDETPEFDKEQLKRLESLGYIK